MRVFLIYTFYYIGDFISRTTMQWFNGFGYKLYSKSMLFSSNLDINDILWKPARKKKKNAK
jgi:hypothetical protein